VACQLCGTISASKKNLRQHLLGVHKIEKENARQLCREAEILKQ
jgi:hypothetical protein